MTSIKQIDPHIWSLPKDIIKKLARLSKTNLFLLKRLITVVKPDPEKVRWVDFSRTCEGVKVQVFKIFFSTGEASSDITVHPRQFYNHLKRAGIVEWDRKAGGAYLKISPEEILVAIPGESIEGLFSIEEQLIICYLAEVMEKRWGKEKKQKETGIEKITKLLRKKGLKRLDERSVRKYIDKLSSQRVDETIWWQGLHGSEEKPEKKQKEIKQLTNPNPKVITLDKKTLRKLSKLNPSYLYLLKILIEKVKADPENILWKNLRETCKDRDILAFTYTRGRNENGWIKAKHEHLFNMLKRSRIIKKEEDCWKLTIKREDLLIAVPVWDNEKIMSIMNQLLVCYIKTVQENMPRIKWVKETGASRLESFIKEMGVENGKIDAIINHLEYLGGENIAVAKWWLKNHKQLDRDKLLEITILQYLKRVRINESEKDWKRKTFFKEVIKFLKSREIYSSNAVIKNAMARMAERGVDEASWWIMVHNRKLAKSYRESYILNYIQNIRKMDEKEWRKKITPGVIARELKVITGGIMKETVKTYLIALAKEGNKDALWWVEVYEVEIET